MTRAAPVLLALILAGTAFAAGETPAFFTEIAALLVISALVAYGSYRLGLMPLIGFLIAGVLIGPSVLGLIHDPELIEAAAEVGVILLLFTIGIEFSLERLARIRRLILLGGGLQVGLVVAVVTGLLMLFGVNLQASIFTGCLIALSSTAMVMKLLADRGEANTVAGQISHGILIFQDLAVVWVVLLVPVLAGDSAGGLWGILWPLLKAAGIVLLVIVVAGRVMPKILEAVARACSQEIFLLSVIAICFGTAYLTSLAGVSLALGAFLAGLVISESRFGHQAFSEIMPLQILFSAAFFVSVGLMLDLRFLVTHLPAVLGVVLGVLVLKSLVTAFSARLLGYPLGVAAASGLMLAQIGEFSFVLERTGSALGLAPAGIAGVGAQTFIAATVLLMIVTPFLAQAGRALERRLAAHPGGGMVGMPSAEAPPANPDAFAHLDSHVIVAGYGAMAAKIVAALDRASLPYIILTLSPEGASAASAAGRAAILGDYAKGYILEHAGIDRARLLVIADDEPATAHRVVAVARVRNPDLRIVARVRAETSAPELEHAGADVVVSDERASVQGILTPLLARFGVEHRLVDEAIEAAFEAPSEPALPDRRLMLCEEERTSGRCSHLGQVTAVVPAAEGCQACLAQGDTWVHLRVCMTCGHVGCCDSSKNKHATAHFHETQHPVVKSLEPGEHWSWCYLDGTTL